MVLISARRRADHGHLPRGGVDPDRGGRVRRAFVERAAIVLLEGYLWDVDAAKEAMRHAAATAHDADGSVALSLSDPFCVARHQREFLDLLVDDVDILLGNEEEITMLFGAASHPQAP